MFASEAYRPAQPRARFTALLLIAGAHLTLVIAIALLGGTHAAIEKAKPLFVQFVAPAPAPPSPPVVARVPLPTFRTPEIQLPLPSIETIAVRLEERPPVANPVTHAVPIVAEAPKATPAAASPDPPRFDLSYLNNPAPVYPPLSKRLREEGRVVLRVLVSPSGLVEEIQVSMGSGYARLDEAARDAVRRWKFVPARAGGQAVAGWALVPIAFNLQA